MLERFISSIPHPRGVVIFACTGCTLSQPACKYTGAIAGRVTARENEQTTFTLAEGRDTASSLRSGGGGSGRRVFINGIRGIIDGVPCGTGVCPPARERETAHSSTYDRPGRRILSIRPIDRVVIWIHASRRPHLLSTPPLGIQCVYVLRRLSGCLVDVLEP